MPKKGKNIYKRKDGRWEGRYLLRIDENGKKKYASLYGKTYSEVEKKLADAKKNFVPKNTNNENVEVSEVATCWFNEKKKNIKLSSCSAYSLHLKKHIIPRFGKYKVSQVTQDEIQQFVNELQKNGFSKRFIMSIVQTLNSIIKYGVNTDNIQIEKEINNDSKHLRGHDLNKFLDFLKTDIDLTKLGILCVIYTGIRLGELCALKWKDIDLETGQMFVNKHMQRVEETEEEGINQTRVLILQTDERRIPLPNALLDVLSKYKGRDNEYLLTGNLKEYIEPRTIQYELAKYAKAADIEKICFSALRDTFAIRAIELGMDLRVLAEILGISISAVVKYFPYVNISSNKVEEMNKMNNL